MQVENILVNLFLVYNNSVGYEWTINLSQHILTVWMSRRVTSLTLIFSTDVYKPLCNFIPLEVFRKFQHFSFLWVYSGLLAVIMLFRVNSLMNLFVIQTRTRRLHSNLGQNSWASRSNTISNTQIYYSFMKRAYYEQL